MHEQYMDFFIGVFCLYVFFPAVSQKATAMEPAGFACLLYLCPFGNLWWYCYLKYLGIQSSRKDGISANLRSWNARKLPGRTLLLKLSTLLKTVGGPRRMLPSNAKLTSWLVVLIRFLLSLWHAVARMIFFASPPRVLAFILIICTLKSYLLQVKTQTSNVEPVLIYLERNPRIIRFWALSRIQT